MYCCVYQYCFVCYFLHIFVNIVISYHLNTIILSNDWWYFMVVLICISLTTDDVEHICISLSIIVCVLWKKCLFRSFVFDVSNKMYGFLFKRFVCLLFYVYDCFTCTWVLCESTWSLMRSEKETEPLELELLTSVSQHVGAEIHTQVLCKNSKCS